MVSRGFSHTSHYIVTVKNSCKYNPKNITNCNKSIYGVTFEAFLIQYFNIILMMVYIAKTLSQIIAINSIVINVLKRSRWNIVVFLSFYELIFSIFLLQRKARYPSMKECLTYNASTRVRTKIVFHASL